MVGMGAQVRHANSSARPLLPPKEPDRQRVETIRQRLAVVQVFDCGVRHLHSLRMVLFECRKVAYAYMSDYKPPNVLKDGIDNYKPAAVHPATHPEWRDLGNNDVLAIGDQFRLKAQDSSQWTQICEADCGTPVHRWPGCEFRRRVEPQPAVGAGEKYWHETKRCPGCYEYGILSYLSGKYYCSKCDATWDYNHLSVWQKGYDAATKQPCHRRCAELERERDAILGEKKIAVDCGLALADERDALKAKCAELDRQLAEVKRQHEIDLAYQDAEECDLCKQVDAELSTIQAKCVGLEKALREIRDYGERRIECRDVFDRVHRMRDIANAALGEKEAS